jgi:hypothetical protein
MKRIAARQPTGGGESAEIAERVALKNCGVVSAIPLS